MSRLMACWYEAGSSNPSAAAIAIRHVYTKPNEQGVIVPVLFNYHSTVNRSMRQSVLSWIASCLQKDICRTKASMFINVDNVMCLKQRNTHNANSRRKSPKYGVRDS
ncbi:hypothetical protein ACMFMG_003470 [Clarireedia jacksonii]